MSGGFWRFADFPCNILKYGHHKFLRASIRQQDFTVALKHFMNKKSKKIGKIQE